MLLLANNTEMLLLANNTEMLLLANNRVIITLHIKISFIFAELNVAINLQSVLCLFALPEDGQTVPNML
jgi:hypothetical protein